MKKTLALALALILVLSMMPTAFAAHDDHTITITHGVAGYNYEAYQIFDGDVNEKGVLTNIKWGKAFANEAAITEMMGKLKTAEVNGTMPFSACTTLDDIVVVLEGLGHTDDPVAIKFAEVVAEYATIKTSSATYNAGEGKYVIGGLEDGYYLVKNTSIDPSVEHPNVSRFILRVVANVTVGHKNDYPTVDKKIIDEVDNPKTDGNETTGVTDNEAGIGDEVTYQITATVPNNLADYDTYYLAFLDTLSAGLTYVDGSIKVYVDGVDVTAYFGKKIVTSSTNTEITVWIQDLLALDNDMDPATPTHEYLTVDGKTIGKITGNSTILVTYKAILNEHAQIGDKGNPNVVKLQYSNNPNQDGDGSTTPPPPPPSDPNPEVPTGITPEKEVETWTTSLNIQKVDPLGNALTGAEFELRGEMIKKNKITGTEFVEATDGTYWLLLNGTYTTTAPVTATEHEYADIAKKYKRQAIDEVRDAVASTEGGVTTYAVKAYVDETGKLTFSGLGVGTYTLTEITAPSGYNKLENPITIVIDFEQDGANYEFLIGTGTDSSVIYNDVTNSFYVDIYNYEGSVLPSTGGMGTTLFYTIGGILVLAAVTLLITKKRMIVA